MLIALRRRLSSEAGLSLPEIMITVVIVALAFVAILGGMMTSITASNYHRKAASADAVLRDFAELVKDNSLVPYVKGATTYAWPASVQLPTSTDGVTYTPTVIGVQCWTGATVSGTTVTPIYGPCTTDLGLQLVTLQVVSSDGLATEAVTISKRRVS